MILNGYTQIKERDELGRFVPSEAVEELRMKDIQQIMNRTVREDFMNRFRRAHSNGSKHSKEMLLTKLNTEVKKELHLQNNKLKDIQNDIMALQTDEERKKAIMKINDTSTRIKLIAHNQSLFDKKPNVNEPTVIWDEQAGMYLTEEQQKSEKRSQIMAIKNNKERHAMIAANLNLFS